MRLIFSYLIFSTYVKPQMNQFENNEKPKTIFWVHIRWQPPLVALILQTMEHSLLAFPSQIRAQEIWWKDAIKLQCAILRMVTRQKHKAFHTYQVNQNTWMPDLISCSHLKALFLLLSSRNLNTFLQLPVLLYFTFLSHTPPDVTLLFDSPTPFSCLSFWFSLLSFTWKTPRNSIWMI